MNGTASANLVPSERGQDAPTVRVPPELAGRVGRLGLELRYQARPGWCWAAVAEAVERFYEPDSPVTQRALAREFLPAEGDAPATPWHPVAVLRARGFLAEALAGPAALDCIRQELCARRPLAAVFTRAGEAYGHAVVLAGIAADGALLVLDPETVGGGASLLPYTRFAGRGYRGAPCRATLLTRPRDGRATHT